MPKTRNGFYLWCGGVFVLASTWTGITAAGGLVEWVLRTQGIFL